MPDVKPPTGNGKGKACIERALAAGLLDEARARKLLKDIARIEGERFDAEGPLGGARQAGIDALEQAQFDADLRRRAALQQLLDQDRIAKNLNAAQERLKLADQFGLLRSVVDATGQGELGFRGAVQEARRVKSAAHQTLNDVLFRFRRKSFGRARDKAGLLDVVKEIFGETTGNAAAREMAAAWKETAEQLRKQFNALGGAIPKLSSWILPQNHNMLKVRKASFEEWHDVIAPKLDRAKMLDFATGKPMGDRQFDALLRDVYDGIRSGGWDTREPKNFQRGSPIASRHRESRILHFADAEGWLAYQQKFGQGDAFDAMMAHIDDSAREIGAMRAMGPNPSATVTFLTQRALKQAAALPGNAPLNRAESKTQGLATLYDHYIGSANRPVNSRWARGFVALRQTLTAAQLGSAVISAITDVGFQRVTAKYNGLPYWKVMARQMALLNPASHEDRKLAVRLGLIAEEWSSIAATQMRYSGEQLSGEISRRLSDGILRVSGLGAWTQAGRWAFGMEFMGLLADNAGKGHGGLSKELQRALKHYNITAEDWDHIRATSIYAPEKGGFLRPDDLMRRADLDPKHADELATKLLDMIQSETEFAVPSASLLGKASVLGDARPGSIPGELVRSTLMYKNFAVTLMHTHVARAASQQGAWNKLGYAAHLVTATTVMGALAIQLKELANGKDPRPMNSPKFMLAAMLQGGGLGLFGDFLFAANSRFGASRYAAAAGPVVGFGADTLGLLAGNTVEAVGSGKSQFGRDAVKYAALYTPGSSLWYLRYAAQRLLFDEAQRLVDPNAELSFKGRRIAQGTNSGNDFFGEPGGGLIPQRAPDFGNVLRTFKEGQLANKIRRDGGDPYDPAFAGLKSIDDYKAAQKQRKKMQRLNRQFRDKERGFKRPRAKKPGPGSGAIQVPG
jgi:hypothetical protein